MAITTDPGPPGPPSSASAGPATVSGGWAVLSAVLAVAAALGVGELVAALVSPASSPYLAVGQAAIRLTPEWLKELAIAWFGVYDKVALLTGMSLTILVVAVLAGLASRRDERPGLLLVVAMGLLSLAAVITAPTFGAGDLLAPAAALVVGALVWLGLHRQARTTGAHTSAGSPDRRRLLLSAVGVAVGAGVTGLVGRALASGGTSPDSVGPLPAPARPPVVPRAGADFVANGTPSWLTAPADFYRIDTALSVPRLSTADWSLRIHGLVDREITVDYASLRARRLIEAPITLGCVSNEVGGNLISNGLFLGVPVSDLLAEAGVRPGAEQIISTSSDGWNCNTPLGPLTDGRPAMLAIGQNGAALPVEHGFPVRMVVPGLYGYVSACKWITDIEVTTYDGPLSYWEQRGWGKFGPVKTESRIDVPRTGSTVPAGTTVLAGVAWAQHTGVDVVEVQVDEGPWQRAELAAEPTVDSWRMWRLRSTLAPGAHEVRVRATDRSGYTQTRQEVPSIPDGATGWHTVSVTAV